MPETNRNVLARINSDPVLQYALLAAITLLAAVLRLYKLGEWSFWIDEMFTLGHVQAHFMDFQTAVQNLPPSRNWVPLSLLLIGSTFNILGVSEWSARLVPAIIGILSIPILYFPVKRVFGGVAGLITALLLAVSTWHIYWSQNARGYTSLMLLYMLALFAFYFWLEQDRLLYFLLFVILAYLAISERLVALLIVPVVLSYPLFLRFLPFERPPGLRVRNILLMISPVILLAGYEAYSFGTSGQSILYGIADELVDTFLGGSIEKPYTQAIYIVYAIGVSLVAIATFTGLYLLSQRSRPGLLLFVGATVPLILVIVVTPFMFTEERYAFVTLPCWIILGAVGVNEVFVRARNYETLIAIGILAMLLGDAAVGNMMYFRVNNGNRRDWKGAFALVEERGGKEDIVVSTFSQLGDYYLDRETVSWQETNPADVMSSGKRVWFVLIPEMAYAWNSVDFLSWVSTNSRLIDIQYLRGPDATTLYIYYYDPAGHLEAE